MRRGSGSILGAGLLAVGIGLVGYTLYQWFADPPPALVPMVETPPDPPISADPLLSWPIPPQAAFSPETSLQAPVSSADVLADLDQEKMPEASGQPRVDTIGGSGGFIPGPAATRPMAIPWADEGGAGPATAAATGTHTIAAGETFASIARTYLGSQARWTEIAQLNPLVDPLRLRVGQVIQLPASVAQTQGRADTSDPQAPDPPAELTIPADARTHIVREGDTFWTIAQEYYGDGAQWQRIYRANRQIVGANPDRLSTGMKLIIPPKPTE